MARENVLPPTEPAVQAGSLGSPAPVLPAAETAHEPTVTEVEAEPKSPVAARFGDDERVNVASQWQLMWWKFRKHRLAVISAWVVLGLYVVAAFVEPIAPYDPEQQDVRSAYQPPTAIHLWDSQGAFRGPFVYGTTRRRNLETLSQE